MCDPSLIDTHLYKIYSYKFTKKKALFVFPNSDR